MKKIISLAVIVLLLMGVAVACYAIEGDAWKNNTGEIDLTEMTVSGDGIEVCDGDILITAGGDFEVTGENADAMIKVSAEDKVKLRLSGMSLANLDGPAIYFENAEKGFITITEGTENYISDSAEYSAEDADAALFSNDDLEIKGNGKLTVSGNYKHGIASDDDLSIENGTIIINACEHGVKVNDTLSIIGGSVDITADTGKGMKAGLELIIDGGELNIVSQADEGLESKGILTINGGDINITSADDGINTGSESTTDITTEAPVMPQFPDNGEIPVKPEGRVPGERTPVGHGQKPYDGMPDGEIPPRNDFAGRGQRPEAEMTQVPEGGMSLQHGFGDGFGSVDEETAKAHEITINGGNIHINANGDGIDSNGNLTITGGNLIIDGPEGNGDGPLDSQGAMSITGGEIVLVSSAGMIQLPRSNDAVNSLRVIFMERGEAGDTITVTDGDNNNIMSHTAVKSYQALVFISGMLETGKSCSVSVNGETVYTVTIGEGITSAGQMQGFGDGRGPVGNREGFRKGISVSVDGENVQFETQPFIKNDSTLVGFRAILESLGAEVVWDETTRTVTAKKGDIEIVLVIDSVKATVNGEEKTLPAAPEIVNDSTMIPVRFISEELGMKVDWDEVNQHIRVISN